MGLLDLGKAAEASRGTRDAEAGKSPRPVGGLVDSLFGSDRSLQESRKEYLDAYTAASVNRLANASGAPKKCPFA